VVAVVSSMERLVCIHKHPAKLPKPLSSAKMNDA